MALGVPSATRANAVGCAHPLWKVRVDVAREVTEKLIDDLEGSEASETVSFALDGASYEIDLSKRNAAAFRKALGRYVSAGRRQGGSSRAGRRRGAKATGKGEKPKRDFDLAQLREWAGANRVSVPSRGRIPQAVIEEYKAAGGR
jgi:nucleoid-associated protein Lsr2